MESQHRELGVEFKSKKIYNIIYEDHIDSEEHGHIIGSIWKMQISEMDDTRASCKEREEIKRGESQ